MKNMINLEVLGTTADGVNVYRHPDGHPHREDLLAETIAKIDTAGAPFIRQTIDLGRVIGKDHLVETNRNSQIVYRKRGNRAGLSRMVLNQKADDTQHVTIVMCKCNDDEPEFAGKYVVVTLFEGKPGEREPWDKSVKDNPVALARAQAFWSTHALVPED